MLRFSRNKTTTMKPKVHEHQTKFFKNVSKKFLSLFLILLFAVGCQKNDAVADSAMAVTVSDKGYYSEAADTVAVAAMEMNVPPKDGKTNLVSDEEEEIVQPKIIKNANLRFETDDLEKTYNQVSSQIKKYNASIQNDSEEKSYNSVSRDLTIRIPSQNFDAFIQGISTGVPYFDTKEISSQDVTEEYIDVASRIKTKKVLEARYLELLKKATKVSEMMEVERQLSEIREEIEAKEGRLKYLKNRVAFSTVNLSFYKTLAQESGATVSYGTKIGNAVKSGFNGISSFFIWVIEVWPFIIILVALIYLIRKRFKKKNKKDDD